MTNWNIEQNITTLADSKRLVEAGISLEADGWHRSIDGGDTWFFTSREDQDPSKLTTEHCINIPSVRLDKLLSLLPGWCFTGRLPLSMSNDIELIEIGEKTYHELMPLITNTRGKQAISAAVELLLLLKKEGLLDD